MNTEWYLYIIFENIFDSEKNMRRFWIQLSTQCVLIEKNKLARQIMKYSNNHFKLSQDYCDLLYLIVFCMHAFPSANMFIITLYYDKI